MPIIHNGDHAQFEIDNANTPPEKRPDWPLPSFDARDWAAHFLKINPDCGIDEGVMISWFANALMRGYDECTSQAAREEAHEAKIAESTAAALDMVERDFG